VIKLSIPDPIKSDIDTKKEISCDKLDKLIFPCIEKMVTLLDNYENVPTPFLDPNVLKYICSGIKDNHQVIRKIYAEYSINEKSKTICAIPLVRTQLETVFQVAILIKQPDIYFPLLTKSTQSALYSKLFYEQCERVNLPKYKRSEANLIQMRNSLIKEEILNEKEINKIEEKIRNGENQDFRKFPLPIKILEKFESEFRDDKILEILRRLYIEYQWLSNIAHGNETPAYARYIFSNKKLSSEKLLVNEILEPNLILNYLSIVIILTNLKKVLKNPVHVIVSLANIWDYFEGCSLLTKKIWDVWGRKELNQLFCNDFHNSIK